MGDWKDEVAKVKSALIRQPTTRRTQRLVSVPVPPPDAQDSDWKDGVKPLSTHNRVETWKLVRQDAKDTDRGREKTKPAKVKAKKANHKPMRRRVRDDLPSMDFIHQVYGGGSPKAKRPSLETPQHTIRIPSIAELPRVALTKKDEYREPEAWVCKGAAIQPPGYEGGRVLRVRMGIDFGTSYTKVALRVRDKVLFVNWKGVRKGKELYLLPGEISHFHDDRTRLGRAPGVSDVQGSLKSPFLALKSRPKIAYQSSTVFLAWVMRYARAWLYRYHPELIQGRTLAWTVNIGAATDPWSRCSIVSSYREVVTCAWQLSQVSGELTLNAAKELLRGRQCVPEGLDDVNVIPEFVAQILGYVKSPQRLDGLHLLVDVGAGTLDVAAFNIYRNPREQADRYPIFEGSVDSLGTHVLMGARLSTAVSDIVGWEDDGEVPTPEKLVELTDLDISAVKVIDHGFERIVAQKIASVLQRTRQKRYPGAREWKHGLRVFLAGGGSHCSIYRRSVLKAFESLGVKALLTDFPALDSLDQLKDSDFHRLSVAYGLTYDADSIGTIVRPQDIEDIKPFSTVRERPDRDELYSK